MAIKSETRHTKAIENRESVRSWPTPHPHDTWFLSLILLVGLGSVFAFSRLGAALTQPAIGTTTKLAQEQLYNFPTNAGLMQPAIDTQGNLWVGEMYANRLASLNTHTGMVKTWQAPHGNDGIMDVTIAANGNVWYVEQDANYIGSFNPTTQKFQVFPLNKCNGRAVGPQDLQFDAQGNLWFTGASGGCIGVLHPTSGQIQLWPVPAPRTGVAALPYSLTITHSGQIWFGYLTGGALGYFDPTTGHTQLYHLKNAGVQIFSMAADAQGRLWFSEILPGAIGMLDPKTSKMTELPVPASGGQPAALYELVVTPNGTVWSVNSGADTLVAYSPTQNHFTIFKLATLTGAPYGLTLDTHNYLWVTYSGSEENAVGKIQASI